MKLSEITKYEFLSRLKNPHHALIRRKLRELRGLIKPKGWSLRYHYDKDDDWFNINIKNESFRINDKPNPGAYEYRNVDIFNDKEIISAITFTLPESFITIYEEETHSYIRLSIRGTPRASV